MKSLINSIMVLVFLSGCVFPGPCCGYDVNCNKDISNTAWYKKRTSCINVQQNIAKKLLQQNYNERIDSEIYSECVKNTDYKFKIIN